MQGVFVNYKRPVTKTAFKQAVKDEPQRVDLEAMSMFGNEFNGPIVDMPEGVPAYVVGPDPYTKRNWYANITRTGDSFKVE